jgi:hypothetical protein
MGMLDEEKSGSKKEKAQAAGKKKTPSMRQLLLQGQNHGLRLLIGCK